MTSTYQYSVRTLLYVVYSITPINNHSHVRTYAWQMVVFTRFHANLTRWVKLSHGQGDQSIPRTRKWHHTHGLHNTAHTKQQPYTYNTHVRLHHNKCFTCRGHRSSQSSHISHKYATLMSPNKGDTAVCGSSIFCLLDDWGDDHWLPQIGLRSTWPWFSFCWPGQVGVKPSDYYHLPLIPKHWAQSTNSPSCKQTYQWAYNDAGHPG